MKLSRFSPAITNILFADDILLFGKASRMEAHNILSILAKYSAASGQKINYHKSSIFFSKNTPQNLKSEILRSMGMKEKYLGLPAMWEKSKCQALDFIKERIVSKTEAWRQKLLSQAGREALIKSVLSAIPAYSMTILKYPKSFCAQLNAMLSSFWWGSKQEGKSMVWMSWMKAWRSNFHGGMGFRELEKFNLACLAKQSWRLLHNPYALWAKVIKGLHFPRTSFWQAVK